MKYFVFCLSFMLHATGVSLAQQGGSSPAIQKTTPNAERRSQVSQPLPDTVRTSRAIPPPSRDQQIGRDGDVLLRKSLLEKRAKLETDLMIARQNKEKVAQHRPELGEYMDHEIADKEQQLDMVNRKIAYLSQAKGEPDAVKAPTFRSVSSETALSELLQRKAELEMDIERAKQIASKKTSFDPANAQRSGRSLSDKQAELESIDKKIYELHRKGLDIPANSR